MSTSHSRFIPMSLNVDSCRGRFRPQVGDLYRPPRARPGERIAVHSGHQQGTLILAYAFHPPAPFRYHLRAMVERKPRARSRYPVRKRSRRLKLLKILAVLVSLAVVVTGIFLIRYYYIFDSLIRAKLGKHEGVIETEIYASPVYLSSGKRIAPQDLVLKLRRLGYAEQETG